MCANCRSEHPVPGSTQWCLAPFSDNGARHPSGAWHLTDAMYVSAMARVAVITGAGTGVGRGAAIALAADGFTIVLAGRRPEPLHEVAAELGDGHLVVPADVADPESVDRLFTTF